MNLEVGLKLFNVTDMKAVWTYECLVFNFQKMPIMHVCLCPLNWYTMIFQLIVLSQPPFFLSALSPSTCDWIAYLNWVLEKYQTITWIKFEIHKHSLPCNSKNAIIPSLYPYTISAIIVCTYFSIMASRFVFF